MSVLADPEQQKLAGGHIVANSIAAGLLDLTTKTWRKISERAIRQGRHGLVGTSLPGDIEKVWELETRDGQKFRARRLQPWDREKVLADFSRLSPESRYFRYLTMVNHLSGDRLESLVDVENLQNVVLGVINTDSEDHEGIAVVRYSRADEFAPTAEFAITIADDWQGKGLGKTLMLLIMQIAAENGIRVLTGEVFHENMAMKKLLMSLGATVTRGDMGVDKIILPVPANPWTVHRQLKKRLKAYEVGEAHLADLVE